MGNTLQGNGAVEEAQRILREDTVNCSDYLMSFDTSDGGNADAFVAMYDSEFLYVRELGWLHWNGKYWEQDEAKVMLAMRNSFDTRHDCFNRHGRDNEANQTKRATYKLRAALEQAESILATPIEDFDTNRDEINVDNGVYNLKTGTLIPHDPSQFFTYCLRAPYDNEADMTVIEGFMVKVLTREGEDKPNQELIDFVQTALGYSLTGHTKEEKLFYLYGKLGRNGKGSITEALMELIPSPIAMEVDFSTFIAKRDGDAQNFDLAGMKPSRLIFASESNKYQMLNPASIKKLTGGNWVRARHLYKDFFEYRPQYKPWLSSNHPVNGDPDDSVLWNRVLVIELPNSYIDREDKDLKDRLKTLQAQTGLLRWLAIGAKRWYKDGLVIPEQVKLSTKRQQEDINVFSNWEEEDTEHQDGYFVAHTDLYQNYVTWCEAQGVTPKGRNQFTEAMEKRGYTKDRSSGQRGFTGIRIVAEYEKIKILEKMTYIYRPFDDE